MRYMNTTGDVRLDYRNSTSLVARPRTGSTLSALQAMAMHNYILFLSRSCHGRSLAADNAVIWRMSTPTQ